jgi:hypothetical protein
MAIKNIPIEIIKLKYNLYFLKDLSLICFLENLFLKWDKKIA